MLSASTPPPAATAPKSARGLRRWLWPDKATLFAWHGWVGLNTGLMLFVVCFSGAVAVLSHEIDWLLNPALRVAPVRAPMQWDAVARGAAAALPEGRVSYVFAPRGPRYASEVLVRTAEGQTRRVYVHPISGDVQGHTSYFNVQRFFRSFHYALFISGPVHGLFVVCFFAFTLLFSVVTGLLFYQGWWKHLFRLRLRAGARAFWSSLHRLLGSWSLACSVVVALTGIWYFAELTMNRSPARPAWLYAPPPKVAAEVVAARPPGQAPLPPGELVARAQAALPGLEPKSLGLPAGPEDGAYVDGQTGEWLVRARASQVILDPYSGEILRARRASDLSVPGRWVDTADELHFGTLGRWENLPFKVLWSFLGMALPVLVLSGAYLSFRRVRPTRQTGFWISSLLTGAILVWSGIGGWREAHDYGVPLSTAAETVRRLRVPEDVTWPALLFIAGFIAVLLAVIALWFRVASAASSNAVPRLPVRG